MDIPKNCCECQYMTTCNSYYMGLGCKYNKANRKIITFVLACILAFTSITYNVMARENSTDSIVEEEIVIDAEDVGIETIEEYEVLPENDTEKVYHEENVEVEYEETESYNIPEEEPVEETEENYDTEIVSEEPSEEMEIEYEEDAFVEPNCFDCETCEECYKCDECTYTEEVGFDEDINPNGGYYLDKYCTVCGHGTSVPISEEEYINYGN